MIYTDSILKPIYQGQAYIAANGTQYPAGFPLNEIPGIVLVTETGQPVDNTLVVTGFIIDNTHTQVWQTRAKTLTELTAEANSGIKAQIEALEATQTPRRIRESLTDPTWIKNLETQIAALRTQLTE